MNRKELIYFTGKCLTLDERPELRDIILSNCRQQKIDYKSFIKLCSDHLILPLLYLKFRDHDILESLPKEFQELLNTIYELNLKRNQQILQEIMVINGEVVEQGITPIFLKGTGNLLDGLYNHPGERIIGDIDLLVPSKDLLKTVEVIKNVGYLTDNPLTPYYNMDEMKHYPALYKENAAADIEVHQFPVNLGFLHILNTEMIDKEKKSASVYPAFKVLSDDHKTVLNFIHARLDHKGHFLGTVSLRDVYDLYCLSKKTNIESVFTNINQKRAIAYAVLAQEILGSPGIFISKKNFYSKYTCFWHAFNLKFGFLYPIHQKIFIIIKSIFIGYPRQLIKATYDPGMRKSIIKRMSSPIYRAGVFNSYVALFDKNKPTE